MWQPHNLSSRRLTDTIQSIFEDRNGLGKWQNTNNQRVTRDIVFQDKSLQEWLSTALKIHHGPRRDQSNQPLGFLTPALLGEMWASFLKTHALEPKNRVLHALSAAGGTASISTDPRSVEVATIRDHVVSRPRPRRSERIRALTEEKDRLQGI